MKPKKTIIPGGVDEYISSYPKEVQKKLEEIKLIIQQAAPGAIETTSYFQIPGYSYEGYSYNGMFAWFSVNKTHIRLHVIPPVIENYSTELMGYLKTKSIVSFPLDKELPANLVKKLVKASIDTMKERK